MPIVAVLLGAALGAAARPAPLPAALFLGTAGYAMAALFVVQGAPDLALTQVAIETLSTVLFVLVLRRLPDRFERRSHPAARMLRVRDRRRGRRRVVFAFALIAARAHGRPSRSRPRWSSGRCPTATAATSST